MTVKVTKPAINLREKLSELDKPVGLKGSDLMRSETAQDARNLIGAGRKNKFINGSMAVSQRGSSISLSSGGYSIDRVNHIVRGTHDSTYTHSTDVPPGFKKSLKISPNSTHTPTGSDNATFQVGIEGQDLQDLEFGTSNAKTFTVSFYAKSASANSGHQYTFEIRSYPSDGSTTRIKTFPFIVTSSWQRFSFVFTGDTEKDIRKDNGLGFACLWNLAAGPDDIRPQYTDWTTLGLFQAVTGQSNFQNSTSNAFYLTGVQLEVGSIATEFEHLSYAEDLALCQRYYEVLYMSAGTACCYSTGDSTIKYAHTWYFSAEKRAQATVALLDDAAFSVSGGGTITLTGIFTSKDHVMFYYDSGMFRLGDNNQHASVKAEAEL